jgi:hypothetical protein
MSGATQKAKRILAELLGYFLDNKVQDIHLRLTPDEGGHLIEVSGPAREAPADLDSFRLALTDGVQPEMESYYLELLDMGSGRDNHYLLGAMVDRADVVYAEGVLRVSLYIKD